MISTYISHKRLEQISKNEYKSIAERIQALIDAADDTNAGISELNKKKFKSLKIKDISNAIFKNNSDSYTSAHSVEVMLGNIVNGKDKSTTHKIELYADICDYFGVSIDWLYGRSNSPFINSPAIQHPELEQNWRLYSNFVSSLMILSFREKKALDSVFLSMPDQRSMFLESLYDALQYSDDSENNSRVDQDEITEFKIHKATKKLESLIMSIRHEHSQEQ